MSKEHVVPKALVGREFTQWLIDVPVVASAAENFAAATQVLRARKEAQVFRAKRQVLRARKSARRAERAEAIPVDPELLKSAGEVTGIMDRAELVRFALSLLLQPDPSGDAMREERGAAPGFELDY